MSELKKYFLDYKSDEGRGVYKNYSYCSVYDSLLTKYRDKEVSLLEIGIGYGGCLQMWKSYLGQHSQIYGIEMVDRLAFSEERIKIFIGNQGDKEFLKATFSSLPELDVIIDDGSHLSRDQIASFEEGFLHLKSGGLYFCEDTHTSYRELYEGGYKKPGTFIEYCKDIIDFLHFTEDPLIPKKDSWQLIDSITFYSSLVVIKKRPGNV